MACSGQPLTGNRPEALEHGPEYRKLADALARWGADLVTAEIDHATTEEEVSETDATSSSRMELSKFEQELLERIYADYGSLDHRHLALVTRTKGTPWDAVYAGGVGKSRDISHNLIKAQFDDVAARLSR